MKNKDLIENTTDDIQSEVKPVESKKKRFLNELIGLMRIVVIAFLLGFFITKVVIVNAKIPSGSMESTVSEGARVIGSRMAYMFSGPERGDIVIFKYPDDVTTEYLKRVIGLPGEKVEIKDGTVYINDEPLEEDYLKENMLGSYGPYYVPEDCYFMMGDNRNYSKDSRFWEHTYVYRDQIEAKVYFTYYPHMDWLY